MRDAEGRFTRTRAVWPEGDWDDGRLSKGKLFVYRPDYPYAYKDGYALRAHVVWWLHTGQAVPKGMNIHHVNEDKADDRFENLTMMSHADHSRRHNPQRWLRFVCETCGSIFETKKWKWNQGKGRYCSRLCVQQRGA